MAGRSIWGPTKLTDDEIKFVDSLGGCKPDGSDADRKKCLLKYLKAAKKRYRWDGIDSARVIEHCQLALSREYGIRA